MKVNFQNDHYWCGKRAMKEESMGKKYRVRVKSMNVDGTGMAEFNHHKFSLKGVLPGELVTMELIYQTGVNPPPEKRFGGRGKNEKNAAQMNRARLCEIIEPSKDRVTPACLQYGICGGLILYNKSWHPFLKDFMYNQEGIGGN